MGTSLSRWTMAYFVAGLLALIVAELLMLGGFGYPAAPLTAPDTLLLVHLVTIGWLSLLMCGALLQFVPVLVAQRLYSDALSLPALLALVVGLLALLAGFAQLAGRLPEGWPLLATGAVLLLLGFALVLWNLVQTLTAAKARGLPARFVIVGLAALVVTAVLGAIFALVLGGNVGSEPWVTLTGLGLPLHVIAGLGGWLTFTAMGVSYRLLAMFMLAPEIERRITHGALYFGTLALTVAVLGGIVVILMQGEVDWALAAGGVIGMLALAFYGTDIVQLYRKRRRRVIELNSRMAAAALVALGAVVLMVVVLLLIGRLGEQIAAVGYLVMFGWLTGLGLSQLYKIIAFMTWLECYGPVLGKAPTPRVQDLVVEDRARKWFVTYFVAVGFGTMALLADVPLAFQAAAGLQLIGTLGIVGQLWRSRRLADVPAIKRLADTINPPHLLLSQTGR